MAVIRGHCMAGGLIFALCHDFRIMKKFSGQLAFSEVTVGRCLPPAYNFIVKSVLPMYALRTLVMGVMIDTSMAVELEILNGLFKDNLDMIRHIEAFAEEFAPKASNRFVFGELKKRLHAEIIDVCNNDFITPMDIQVFMRPMKVEGGKKV